MGRYPQAPGPVDGFPGRWLLIGLATLTVAGWLFRKRVT